jgi:FkbM family methyltransferase
VTAVEAAPSTAAVLRRNLGANDLGRVRVVEAAVGPPGVDRVTLRFDPRHMGRAALDGGTGSGSQEVPATTLDDVCRELDHIRLIKIDVEGAELAALEGGARTLARTEAVVLECNEDGPAVERLLEDHGFVVSRLRFTNHRLARKP